MENYPTVLVVPLVLLEVVVSVTSEDLRHIADLVEHKWERCKDIPGSDLTAFTLTGQGINISFVVSQERMKAREL